MPDDTAPDTPDESAAALCGEPTTRDRGPCQNPAGMGRPSDTGPCYKHVDGSRLQHGADRARLVLSRLRDILPGTGALGRLKRFVTTAGASTEASTERGGFLSYHAESHAVAVGLSAGFYYGTTGEKKLMAVITGIALYASRGQTKLDAKIVEDIRQEPHYALAAMPVGYVFGFITAYGYVPDNVPIPGSDVLIRWFMTEGYRYFGL